MKERKKEKDRKRKKERRRKERKNEIERKKEREKANRKKEIKCCRGRLLRAEHNKIHNDGVDQRPRLGYHRAPSIEGQDLIVNSL